MQMRNLKNRLSDLSNVAISNSNFILTQTLRLHSYFSKYCIKLLVESE